MPCCMLGAIFLGQCLAAFAWVQKFFGWRESPSQPQRDSRARKHAWGKWLFVALSIELVIFVAIIFFSDQTWQQHQEHLLGSMTDIDVPVYCGAKEPTINTLVTSEISKL